MNRRDSEEAHPFAKRMILRMRCRGIPGAPGEREASNRERCDPKRRSRRLVSEAFPGQDPEEAQMDGSVQPMCGRTTPDKKPFLAGKTGLDSLSKGMPAGGKPDYEVGDRVEHIKYGPGTVEMLEKGPRDYKVKVNFDSAGPKIMYAAFAKLQKI